MDNKFLKLFTIIFQTEADRLKVSHTLVQGKSASSEKTVQIEDKVLEEESQLQIEPTDVPLKIEQNSSKSTLDKSIDDIVRLLYRNDLQVKSLKIKDVDPKKSLYRGKAVRVVNQQ